MVEYKNFVFGGFFVYHLGFEYFLRKVNINYHEKDGAPNLKIEWVFIKTGAPNLKIKWVFINFVFLVAILFSWHMSMWTTMQNMNLLPSKLIKILFILCFGNHFVFGCHFIFVFCGRWNWTTMQNLELLA